MIKKLIALIVLITLTLGVAGCTSPSNTGSPSSSETAQHNASLERLISTYQQVLQENYTVKAYEVTWKNSTTADIDYSVQNKTTNTTTAGTEEFIMFTSTDAATGYVNSQKTGYTLASTVFTPGGAYQRANGHAPAIYKYYAKHTGESLLNLTTYEIYQFDNVVIIGNAKLI
ncbi:MAG: hypothetical protein ACXV5N_12635 [Halobacteriota archaeon]